MLFRSWIRGWLQIVVLLLTAANAAHAQDVSAVNAQASVSEAPQTAAVVRDVHDGSEASASAARRAAPAARPRHAKGVSARLAGGFGLGRPAIGGRAGLGGEFWFSDVLGIGVAGAILRQSAWLGDDSASESVALVGTLRGGAQGSYAYFSLGAGYAHVKHTFRAGLCLGAAECTDRVERYHGMVVGAALGWLLHPLEPLELGPMLRFDLLVDPRGHTPADLAVTLGFELGLAK